MRARILGAGTSSGVPRIGNDWGACDPAEPRNRRTRASLLVEHGDTRILIDSGPDMREQLNAALLEVQQVRADIERLRGRAADPASTGVAARRPLP